MDNQSIQPTPPPPSSGNPSKTFLLILGGITLIVVSAVGGYFIGSNNQPQPSQPVPTIAYTPSPTPTSSIPLHTDEPSITPKTTNSSMSIRYSPKPDWQSYTDDVAKFSLQYNITPTQPYNSHQSLGKHTAGKSVEIYSCNTPPSGPSAGKEVCLGLYTITIYTNYKGGSRKEWMNQNINKDPNCQRYYADFSLANKNALIATSDCSSFGETYILIRNGSQMIVFLTSEYTHNATNGKISLPSWFQDVLSTFQFLN